MNNTNLIFDEEKYSLWEFPDKFTYKDDPSKPLLEDTPEGYKSNLIVKTCKSLEDLLIPIAEPRTLFRKIFNLLFDKTLGYSDYVQSLLIRLDASRT